MSASIKSTHEAAAAAYEQYISDNWDRLQPFEQDQARAYMQAKFQGTPQPQPMMPVNPAPGYPSAAPGYPSMDPGYGYGYGYGMYGGFAPSKREDEGAWAVPVGYLGLLFFTPLAIGCGIYNLSKGRTGHGLAQILIPVAVFVLLLMVIASGP